MRKTTLVFLVLLAWGTVFGQSSTIQPNRGSKGQTLPIIISGQNTQFQSATPTVRLQYSQGSASIRQGTNSGFSNIQVNSPTEISGTLVIPTNVPNGNYDLFVFAGSSTFDQSAFTVQQASRNNIQMNPSGIQPGKSISGLTVTVPGASFKNAQAGIENVWLSKGSIVLENFTNINVQNANSFTADIAVASGVSEGMYDMNVYESNGSMHVQVNAFEIDEDVSLVDRPSLNFSYYPNPAKDFLNLEYSQADGQTNFDILNINGQLIESHEVKHAEGETRFAISDLAKGMYLLRVRKDGEVVTVKKWQKN